MIRVLVLDDDNLFGHLVADSLHRVPDSQFEVTAATAVEEARQSVMSAHQPFDVFLIDQRLGPGPDGITFMQELRHISPSTDAIITGIDDPEIAWRAHQAGAYRYLRKPFIARELILILRSLYEWRAVQQERAWLKTLIEVAQEVQGAFSVLEVADISVRGALRLGCGRARLSLLRNDDTLSGTSQAGQGVVDGFKGLIIPSAESPYVQRSLASREPVLFHGYELGPDYLDRVLASSSFQPPKGTWVSIPLWCADRCLGLLVMDNAIQSYEVTSDQRSLLQLFGSQVATALERAQLVGQETEKERRRLQAALGIAEAVGTTLDLHEILCKIMAKLCELFPHVTPCVLTYYEVGRTLEFQSPSLEFYHIDDPGHLGLTQVSVDGESIASLAARHSLSSKKVEHMIVSDVDRESAYLRLIGSTRSELCVTLMSGENLLGVLALESTKLDFFHADDLDVVRAVAGQISLAIERVRQSEELSFNNLVALAVAWAATMAHDANRVVGYILDRAYLIGLEPGLSDSARQDLELIAESAKQLSATGNAVLQDSRNAELLLLEDQLRRCVTEQLRELSSNIKLQFEFTCIGCRIRAPQAAFRFVVRNLVRNALEAMSGAGTLTVRTRLVDDQWAEVQIQDTGLGVPEQVRLTIFKAPTTTKGENRGFGLLFVRLLVKNMGGTVDLLSSPRDQKGAIFAFKLPLCSDEQTEVQYADVRR